MKCLRCEIHEVVPGFEICVACQEELYEEEQERNQGQLEEEQKRNDNARDAYSGERGEE